MNWILLAAAISAAADVAQAQSVSIQLQSATHGSYSDQLASPGAVSLANDVAHASAFWVDNGQGGFGLTCSAVARGGPGFDFKYYPMAAVTFTVTKSVCLIPLDQQGQVDPLLMGTPALVVFGGSGTGIGSTPNFSPVPGSFGECGGSAWINAGVSYLVNGQSAGGYHSYEEYGNPACHNNSVNAGIVPSPGVLITLGSCFDITLSGALIVGANVGQVVYNPGPLQCTASAMGSLSCGLGFPSLTTSGGVGIPYFQWVECSAGVPGLPMDPYPNPNLPIGTPYCFGDGTATSMACPCSNNSVAGAGRGCANVGGVGSRLSAVGSTSVAADNIIFSADALTGGAALLFAGTNVAAIPLSDGIRCAGGSIRRLGIQVPSAQLVANWGPGLGAVGSWQAGDTRRFQVWYRNGATSPCPSPENANLSNGLEITFTP